ncbi:hypothetical protein [Mesorhizobium abyssinicae]|uniref:hypothetical protein n=1 Tax=Mesorhizobium abyssinicae TaxID=1209958 RepID=UPI00339B4D34
MTRLVPTGRGSYVRAGSITLAELLRRYDLAAERGFTTMTRCEVIAALEAHNV